jgi:hypothetical protein
MYPSFISLLNSRLSFKDSDHSWPIGFVINTNHKAVENPSTYVKTLNLNTM